MAIKEYEEQNNVNVNLEMFDDVEEMETRISTEVLSGKGPDVFLLSSDYNTLDVHKMMKNGSFYALDEWIEEEKSYNGYDEENYFKCVIEEGTYNGQQYILPFSFNMIQFYVDAELIDTSYPQLQDKYTMEELVQVMKKECLRTVDERDSTAVMWMANATYALNMLMEQTQMIALDYDKKQVLLEKDVMEQIADFWKTMLETERISEIYKKYSNNSDYMDHFEFFVDGTSMLNAVRHNVSWYALAEKQPCFYVLPAWNQADSYRATICEYGAVNANSEHPEESYRLLRAIMDYHISYDFNKFQKNISYYLPVNKSVLNSCVEMVKTQRGKGKFTILPLRNNYADYAAQLEEILNHIDNAVLPNTKVGSIVNEVMQPYFDGEKEFDICYSELENRLKLYLSE